MSSNVYPSLPGLAFGVQRSVIPPPVLIRTAPSRREYRARDASAPKYQYSLAYEFLRSATAYAELQTLVGFYNQQGGPFDSFLFTDPDDYQALNQAFAIGDGFSTQFQLSRTMGGFVEPVYDTYGALTVFRNNWAGVYTLYPTARTNYLRQTQAIIAGTSPWNQGASVTSTLTAVAAPDGSTSTYLLTPTAADSTCKQNTASVVGIAGLATFSIWLKCATPYTLRIYISDGTTTAFTACAVTNTWQRFSVGAVLNGTSSWSAQIGGGSTFSNGLSHDTYAWGAQLETGVTPTGYIPTTTAQTTVTDYSISTQGLVTLPAALPIGETLIWVGTYYRRCRFKGDTLDTTKFMRDLWEARKVELISTTS